MQLQIIYHKFWTMCGMPIGWTYPKSTGWSSSSEIKTVKIGATQPGYD